MESHPISRAHYKPLLPAGAVLSAWYKSQPHRSKDNWVAHVPKLLIFRWIRQLCRTAGSKLSPNNLPLLHPRECMSRRKLCQRDIGPTLSRCKPRKLWAREKKSVNMSRLVEEASLQNKVVLLQSSRRSATLKRRLSRSDASVKLDFLSRGWKSCHPFQHNDR